MENSFIDTKEQSDQRYKEKYFSIERRCYLKRTYNITLDEYQTMLKEQKNCCAICGNSQSGSRGKFNTFDVDHDHKTGVVRGLLCRTCNSTVLPAVEHYRWRIQGAKNYLKKHRG